MGVAKARAACVTGGCGFIGSHLVRRLLDGGWDVVVLDNLSVGTVDMLPVSRRLRFIEGDIRDRDAVREAVQGSQVVFHFAAPTDVRMALENPCHDIEHGVLGTQSLLEAMRASRLQKIVYASSSCVYGSGLRQPVLEDSGPLLPSSVYGASKLAGEALISAYCRTFGLQSWIFRFPNVVGPALTHGVILDFVRRLRRNPECLTVYGDGRQTKTYCWVEDCVDGVLSLFSRADADINVYNVTTRGNTSVSRIAELVKEALDLPAAQLAYSGGATGWRGDVPIIQIDGTRAAELGWQARYSSDQAVMRTIHALMATETGWRVPAQASA